jgi:vacuolar iron transporter family protein
MVGAGAAVREVQLAGLASLVAGACAMAIGEYISMRAQVELLERLLAEAQQAMRTDPERERLVLRETLQSHGFDAAVAQEMVLQLARAPERALNVYARAVLGVNPDELGSPWAAAISCMVMFALGALVPLLPWFFTGGSKVVVLSLVLAGGAAVTIGGVLGYFTGRHVLHSALRQLLVITLASAVTFLIGWLFGATIS